VHFFIVKDGDYMIKDEIIKILISEAEKALEKKEIPISAVITDLNGNIISFSHNNRQNTYNILGHAEILAIQKAEKKIKDWRLNGYNMYINLEPCEMCSIIIKEARIDNVYYFLDNNLYKNNNVPRGTLNNKIKIEGYNEEKEKFKKMIDKFFEYKR